YSLVGTAPAGLTWNSSTHTLSGTPTTAGTYGVKLQVSDGHSNTAEQDYTLSVIVNAPPVITSTAVTTVTAGLPYRYDVQAGDADNTSNNPNADPLTYQVSNAPAGMTIDRNGRLSWSPVIANIGTYPGILITVTDLYGATATQTFTL